MDADIAAIREVLNRCAIGCTSGEFDLWISQWAENAVQMPQDAPANVGRAEIERAAKPLFDQVDMHLEIVSIDDVRIIGNLGLTRIAYRLETRPKAGGDAIAAMSEGKALTLYEKQSNGTWKIVYDCFNSSRPPE